MRKSTLIVGGAIAAALVVGTGGGAYAAAQITGANIKDGTITGADVQNRSLSTSDLTEHAIAALKGAKGDTGNTGPAGTNGTNGTNGAPGAKGDKGDKGDAGADAPAATYGVANINVSRGNQAATTWQKLSTDLGSPVGDTVSGTFRFTCSEANAPCSVSVSAYATTSGVAVYPRVLITKDSIDTGAPLGTCEYGDGTNNSGGVAALSSSAVAVTLGIGGSLDCGSSQAYPANGVASEIQVPAGYYNVTSTMQFYKS